MEISTKTKVMNWVLSMGANSGEFKIYYYTENLIFSTIIAVYALALYREIK